MSETQTFSCPNCGDTYLFTGTEHVMHKGPEPLEETRFDMKFRVVVDSCTCVCGAEYGGNGAKVWTKRIVDGDGEDDYHYVTLVASEWITTEVNQERFAREKRARNEVRKQKERETRAAEQKKNGKRDGRRRS